MKRPTPTTVFQLASGRGTTTTARATTAKRIATNSSGGMPVMPQSMTTKLKPHIVATRAAISMSRRVMLLLQRESSGNTSDGFCG